MERDSHSSAEARDLVQKIFRLLEHYESHHQILSEKIHQTELAAEQATRILPMWSDHNHESFGNWNSVMSSSLVSSSGVSTPCRPTDRPSNRSFAPKTPMEAAVTPHVRHPYGDPGYPAVGYPYQVVEVTASRPGGYMPVESCYPANPALMQGPAVNEAQGLGLPALEGVPAIGGPSGNTRSPEGHHLPIVEGPENAQGPRTEQVPGKFFHFFLREVFLILSFILQQILWPLLLQMATKGPKNLPDPCIMLFLADLPCRMRPPIPRHRPPPPPLDPLKPPASRRLSKVPSKLSSSSVRSSSSFLS